MGRRRKSVDQPLLFDGADKPAGKGAYGQATGSAEEVPSETHNLTATEPDPLTDLALTAMARAAAFIRGGQYATAATVLKIAKEEIEGRRQVRTLEADIIAAGDLYVSMDKHGINIEEISRGVALQFKTEDDIRHFLKRGGLLNAMWPHEREEE